MEPDDFLSGSRLDDKYLIETRLGQGGMGAVYRATHLGTKRAVAVKIIHPQFSHDPAFVARFQLEAEALGRLRHPNVVDVTDFGIARTASGPVAYLVMEYLDGRTLAHVLDEERRLSTGWVVDILEQVCSAVGQAHRVGIIHRDLKPENIWLEPNRRGGFTVKVLDFGLATFGDQAELDDRFRSASREARAAIADETRLTPAAVTRAGGVMGTPLYMSPEHCHAEALDARADIYSLGVIAYRMLAGLTPFTGDPPELVRLHATSEPPPLANCPNVPKKVAAVVMSALAKSPAARPQTAAGFASALRASAEGSGTLLRHAISLYSEHFPVFFTISLLAYAPLILMIGLDNIFDRHLLPDRYTPAMSNSAGLLVFAMMVAANLFAYFTISAAAAPVVVQLAIAPLREVRIRMSLDALQRRWRVFAGATLAVLAMTLAGAVFLVVPGMVVAISHALYAPVAMMENGSVRSTLCRARSLARRFWSTVLIITLVQFTLPVLVWIASIDSHFVFRLADDYTPKQIGFSFSLSAGSFLYQLLNILITPLAAIMIAQLYLKMRQGGGETLTDAA